MARHLLIIDANLPGIETIAVAKRRGLWVSFIRSGYRKYPETERIRSIVYQADAVLSIEDCTDEAAVHHAAATLHAYRPVDAVICLLEPAIDTVAKVCAGLGLSFTNAGAVATARDKARTRQVLQAAGLRSLRYRCVQSAEAAEAAAAAIGGPVMVKPQTGYDSLLATAAADPQQAFQAARRLLDGIKTMPPQLRPQLAKGIVVEEYLDGPLVSVELGIRNGCFYRFMLSDHPRSRQDPCIEMGAAMPADLNADQAQACFAYGEQITRALRFDFGILHLEMIVTGSGPVLIDANSRLMGGIMPALYHTLTGSDIQEYLLDIHLNEPLPPLPAPAIGYVAARNIMAARDLTLPDRIELSWLDDHIPPLAAFEAYQLTPGTPVCRRDILACYQVRGDSFAAAAELAEAILDRFETCTAIPLIR